MLGFFFLLFTGFQNNKWDLSKGTTESKDVYQFYLSFFIYLSFFQGHTHSIWRFPGWGWGVKSELQLLAYAQSPHALGRNSVMLLPFVVHPLRGGMGLGSTTSLSSYPSPFGSFFTSSVADDLFGQFLVFLINGCSINNSAAWVCPQEEVSSEFPSLPSWPLPPLKPRAFNTCIFFFSSIFNVLNFLMRVILL